VIRIVVASLIVVIVAGLATRLGGAATPLPLSARLVQAADFAGYVPEPSPKDYRSARTWVSLDTGLAASQVSADVARLHREGFKDVLVEYLDRAPAKQNGVSWVMQLGGGPRGARRQPCRGQGPESGYLLGLLGPGDRSGRRLPRLGQRLHRGERPLRRRPLPLPGRRGVDGGAKTRPHARRPRCRRHQALRESPQPPGPHGLRYLTIERVKRQLECPLVNGRIAPSRCCHGAAAPPQK
jgi:hypothetical protein